MAHNIPTDVTSTGGTQGFTTGTATQSTLQQERADFNSIVAVGEVSSIDLNEGDEYSLSFFYREVGTSSYNEVTVDGLINPRVVRKEITGLNSDTDYEYYIGINGDNSLSSNAVTGGTHFDETVTKENSVTTTALPVTTLGPLTQARNSITVQGEVEDSANLQSGDIFRPFFKYRVAGTSNFTKIDLADTDNPQVFQEKITGLTEDEDYEYVFGASGVEGLIIAAGTPTDTTSTGDTDIFETLAYQEIITPDDGVEQAKRDLVVKYDLNIDVQGTHEFVFNRDGTDEVLNTVTTPNENRQTVTIPDVDRDGQSKTFTLTFTDESGGSGPGDLSRSQTFTIDVVPVAMLTGDQSTFTVE